MGAGGAAGESVVGADLTAGMALGADKVATGASPSATPPQAGQAAPVRWAELAAGASPEALAMLDLMADPLFGRVERGDLSRVARGAVALGRARAKALGLGGAGGAAAGAGKTGTTFRAGSGLGGDGREGDGPARLADLEQAFAELGYPVRRLACDPPGLRAGWRLQAQVTLAGPDPHVDLYEGQLAAKAAALARLGTPASLEDMERLHLAHELFHVLEHREGRTAGQRVGPVRVRRALLPGWTRRPLGSASEAAAHAFAREAAHPPVAPELCDWAVLVDEGARTLDDLRAALARAEELARA